MTRTPRAARSKAAAPAPVNTTANGNGGTPRTQRRQSQQQQTPAKNNASAPPPPPATLQQQRPPATTAMSASDRLAWNLRVLKRHDSTITRIFDQAPYAVLYLFTQTGKVDPSESGKGRKYEGFWDKTNTEGTVFIIERSEAPHYGFFLLNRGGPQSIVQVFHPEDTIELGSDPRFLTIRPGKWERATTPYTVPYVLCEKPGLMCLWISDETVGPRFAYFMNRAKERLAREAREAESGPSASPPLTPLSQVRYHSDGEDENEDAPTQPAVPTQPIPQQQPTQPAPAQPTPAAEKTLDQLFAGLGGTSSSSIFPPAPVPEPTPTTTTTSHTFTHTTHTTTSTTSTAPQPQPLLPAFGQSTPAASSQDLFAALFPSAQPPPLAAPALAPPPPLLEAFAPPPPSSSNLMGGGSLLDQIFASSAAAATSLPSVVPPPVPAPVTPPPTSKNTAAAALSFAESASSEYDPYDDDDEVLVPNSASASSIPAPAPVPPVTSKKEDEDEEDFQELSPPSPSRIPNPLQTPAPASMRTKQRAKRRARSRARRIGGTGSSVDLTTANNASLPPIRGVGVNGKAPVGAGTGGRGREQYIPQNTNEETRLDTRAVSSAILDAYAARSEANGNGEGSGGYEMLSRYDFVSELLTLIHKEPEFVNDLYARYEAARR